MSVNTLEMLMTFSKSLESGSNSNDITYVIDILKAIKKEAPTKEVIQKATKVGSQISSLRKKFQSSANNSELLSLCKDILTKWKATLGTEEESSSSTLKSPIAQLKLRLKPASTSSTSSSSSFDLSQLSDSRRRIYDLLHTNLSLSSSDTALLMTTAKNIEDSIYSFARDAEYTAKARSLIYNIKKNENLRTNLLNGTLSAHELVRLSPIDLATSELRELRRAAQEEDCDARRTDWVEAHLSEIQEQNGLDPDNVWIYEEEPVSECD